MRNMKTNYFYGVQADQYSFIRIPKELVVGEAFTSLSVQAKILYGILLDRVSLSAMNEWKDEAGRVFIYCTLESIQEALGCARSLTSAAFIHL